jgi:hypothetical protein
MSNNTIGPVYSGVVSGVAVSATQDVFELVTHTSSRVRIREIRIGQYSDFGDAASEILGVQLIRGFTTSGSGGSTVTPAKMNQTTGRAAVTVVEANNTTLATTGTGTVIYSDAWNIQSGWWYAPHETEMPIIEVSTRFVVRITTPADAITMNATIVFEEIGTMAVLR